MHRDKGQVSYTTSEKGSVLHGKLPGIRTRNLLIRIYTTGKIREQAQFFKSCPILRLVAASLT